MLRLAGVGANYSVFNKAIRLSTILSLQACLEIFSLCWGYSANAQIIKDESLGNEASRLTPNVEIKGLPADLIEAGATRGINLFHSFREFNIGDSQRIYFANPVGIENILTRVTGGKVSNILGTLGVNGSANLFLINPSGIIFGENARLDLGGSFVASTANGIKFGEDGFFSASSPEIPSQLLTINPSAFFFNQVEAGKIEHKSTAPLGNNFFGLRVPNRRSLLFLGGEINVDGGELDALGGRIELAAIAKDATVGLNVDNNNLSLTVPDGVPRADISISDGAFIDVALEGEGSITINARNLQINEGSILLNGIRRGLGTPEVEADDITINATGTVSLEGAGTIIVNRVASDAVGNGGDVNITANQLLVANRFGLETRMFGEGKAGNINLNVSDTISLDNSSAVFSSLARDAFGNAGNINITTDSLFVTNGSRIDSSTNGLGNGGNIKINASNTVSFDGTNSNANPSTVSSLVNFDARGNSGNIEINTGSFSATNGIHIDTSVFGEGNAGSVNINARDTVSFDGFNNLFPLSPSAIFTRVQQGGVGKGGDINIKAESLLMTNGGQFIANTRGEGDAGNVKIDVRDTASFDGVNSSGLSTAVFTSIGAGGVGKGGNIDIAAESVLITDGAGLVVSNLGKGDAGNATIRATKKVSLDGVGSNGFPSAIFSSVAEDPGGSLEEPIGDSGDINITTDLLSITNGARLGASSVVGQGNTGAIKIKARDIFLDGVGSDGASGVFSAVGSQAIGDSAGIKITTESFSINNGALVSSSTRGEGNGGRIEINAKTLSALNGGQILTTSFSSGDAGDIILNVTDNITLAGSDPNFFDRVAQFLENESVEDVVIGVSPSSGIFANNGENSTGKSGNIFIDPQTVTIRDDAKIAVDNQGTGVGGNVELIAGFLTLDRGQITAETRSNTGGNIKLNLQDLLLLRNGSNISTTAGDEQFGGDGGIITINSPFIVALPQENSDITANAFSGNGGRVDITTKGIFGIQQQPELTDFSDITASSESGVDGQISIDNPDVDPSRGVEELPADVVNATGLINQNLCTAARQGSEFVVTGRGGLPTSPRNVGNVNSTWEDWSVAGEREITKPKPVVRENQAPKKRESTTPIVEAKGWVVDSNGDIVFTAFPAKVNKSGTWLHPLDCQSLRKAS